LRQTAVGGVKIGAAGLVEAVRISAVGSENEFPGTGTG
jgi:hypothetical protein